MFVLIDTLNTETWVDKLNSVVKDVFIPHFDIENEPLLHWSIISYVQFQTSLGKNWKEAKVHENLLNLKKGIEAKYHNPKWIDPIKYLIELYYWEWLSLADVLERVRPLGLKYKDYKWLHYLLVKKLEWNLRENTELSAVQKKRKRNLPEQRWMQRENQRIIAKRWKEILEELDQILLSQAEQWQEGFSAEEYNSFSGKQAKSNKAFYILKCFCWITKNVVIELWRDSWYGARTITRLINSKLEAAKIMFSINEKLEFSVGNISYYLKQNS